MVVKSFWYLPSATILIVTCWILTENSLLVRSAVHAVVSSWIVGHPSSRVASDCIVAVVSPSSCWWLRNVYLIEEQIFVPISALGGGGSSGRWLSDRILLNETGSRHRRTPGHRQRSDLILYTLCNGGIPRHIPPQTNQRWAFLNSTGQAKLMIFAMLNNFSKDWLPTWIKQKILLPQKHVREF